MTTQRPRDVFVGREAELAQLTAALDDALAGRGRIVMLIGEPGIGKSRLCEEVASRAADRGGLVLWGHCYEHDGAPPFWPWVQVLRDHIEARGATQTLEDMGDGAALLAQMAPEIRAHLPGAPVGSADDSASTHFRMFDATAAFLRTAAGARPIVVVLEDLHWADRSSIRLLEYVADGVARAPLMVLGTARDVDAGSSPPTLPLLASLARRGSSGRINLRGLTEVETALLIEAVGPGATASHASAVYRLTEGNPFFTIEAVRLLESTTEGAPAEVAIPEVAQEVIDRRLVSLAESTRQVLVSASLLGREFALDKLQATAEASETKVLTAIDEALEAKLLQRAEGSGDRYRFTHALIHQALYRSLPASRRARRHAGAATALETLYQEEADAHAPELAYHWRQASSAADRDRLVHYSTVAGEQALASYAWGEARRQFEQALAAGVSFPAREMGQLKHGLGRAKAGLSLYADALEEFLAAFAYCDEAGDVERAVAIATFPLAPVSGQEAMRMTARALEMVAPDSREEGRLLSRFARFHDDPFKALDNYDRAIRIHRRHEDTAGLAFTLSRYGATKCTLPEHFDEGLELIEQAVRVGRPVRAFDALVDAHFWGVHAYASRGQLEAARRDAAGALDAATASHNHMRLRQAHRVCMMVAQLTGDWEAALVEADEVEKVSAQARPSLLAVRAIIEAQKGNPERALQLLAESFKPAKLWDENPWFPAWWAPTIAAAKVGLMLDEPNVIREQDDSGEEWNRPASAQDYPVVQWRVGRAVAAALTGDLARARLWHDQLLPKARTMAVDTGGPAAWTTPLSVDRVLGLSAMALGDVEAASDHYEDALSFCRTAGYYPELAWTCRDYARFLLDQGSGDLAKARMLVTEATDIASTLNMRLLGQQFQRIEESLATRRGNRPEHPDGVTEREIEVLRLVAAGKSNREIAEALFISENTVIRHVSNIYSKIGVSNRAEATSYAHRNGLAANSNREP